MKFGLGFLGVLMFVCGVSQTERFVNIRFEPTFNHTPLVLNDKFYRLQNGDSLVFTQFKFYISGVALSQNDSLIFSETESFHLLDASDTATLHFALPYTDFQKYNTLHFNFGIDSATSNSGAFGGPLDPSRGMYWAWQSGYINLKLEGNSVLCNTRKHEFAFHLGGYMWPNLAMQIVSIPEVHQQEITIEIPLDAFFNMLDLSKQNTVMIPGKEAVDLSRKFASIFTIENK